uniref:Uncharacterized protein n=1 Tax=Rhizophora mucronata TaxID=61149 RepID=A0A2P2PPL0_RHIMU
MGSTDYNFKLFQARLTIEDEDEEGYRSSKYLEQ